MAKRKAKPQAGNPTVNKLMEVCRLCVSKDGPFINIFDMEKMIAKKIEDVMLFEIAENDELPHTLCYRCSAKVEEFYEFVQKCSKIHRKLPMKEPLCNPEDKISLAIIQKALECIVNKEAYVVLNRLPEEVVSKATTSTTTSTTTKTTTKTTTTVEKSCNLIEPLNVGLENPTAETKPFNIMDHLTTYKVNDVGVILQCQLCNKYFLNNETVIAHGCAKSGIEPNEDLAEKIIPPEPKAPTTESDMTTNTPLIAESESDSSTDIEFFTPVVAADRDIQTQIQAKPKTGPASKVRPDTSNSAFSNSSVPFTLPNFNVPYNLIIGPNNTFTLVQKDSPNQNQDEGVEENETSRILEGNWDNRLRKRVQDPPTKEPSNKQLRKRK